MWIWTRPALLLGTSFFATVVQGSPALPPPPDSTSLQPAPPLPSPLPDDQCNIGDIVKRADNLTLPSVTRQVMDESILRFRFISQPNVFLLECTHMPTPLNFLSKSGKCRRTISTALYTRMSARIGATSRFVCHFVRWTSTQDLIDFA